MVDISIPDALVEELGVDKNNRDEVEEAVIAALQAYLLDNEDFDQENT